MDTPQMTPPELLLQMFNDAVAAAQPMVSIAKFLPQAATGKTIVIGAGKGSAAMAQAFEKHWQGGDYEGLVVTRYGYAAKCEKIEIVEAAHPVPDQAGAMAAQRILQKVQGLSQDDLVICLISGGGSSLLSMPAEGLTLKDKQTVNQALLRSGATISEMNCVRKHLSAIKGGRLAAAAAPAKLVALLISDVPGDEVTSIASGPTVADPSTYSDALEIIQRYEVQIPDAVLQHLKDGVQGKLSETPKPGDAELGNAEYHIIAAPQISLTAAAQTAQQNGYNPLILGDSIEGEAQDVALVHAGIAQQVAKYGQPINTPCVLLSGGETTVTVNGDGRGGRNAEFALALAKALQAKSGIYAIACDTDGIDGSEDNAGAMVKPNTLARAEALGLKANDYLANNDAYSYFSKIDDLVMTGPTMTNVNDFRAILIEDER